MRAGMLGWRAAALGLEDADALLDVLPRRLAAEDGAQALLQRSDVRLEQPGLQLGEQAVHAEERVGLVGREPQARQLVARPRTRLAEAVAVRLAVVLDRRAGARVHAGCGRPGPDRPAWDPAAARPGCTASCDLHLRSRSGTCGGPAAARVS